MLTLYEEILLIAIHEAKGSVIRLASDRLRPAIIGATLAELALLGKIQTTNNHRLQLVDNSPIADLILNKILETLNESEKERKYTTWISALGQQYDVIYQLTVESLVLKGILTQEDDRFVWVIPSPLQAEMKASAKHLIINRLRGVVLALEDAQPRDIALLGILKACGLLYLVFLRDERKLASQCIYELGINNAFKFAPIQTIQEIETAITALVDED